MALRYRHLAELYFPACRFTRQYEIRRHDGVVIYNTVVPRYLGYQEWFTPGFAPVGIMTMFTRTFPFGEWEEVPEDLF